MVKFQQMFVKVSLLLLIFGYGVVEGQNWGIESFGATGFRNSQIDSLNVRYVGRWPGGPSFAVATQDDYVYLSYGGVIVSLDISNPDTVFALSRVATPDFGYVRNLWIKDTLLFVAARYAGLLIYDISKPESLCLIGICDTIGDTWDVVVKDSFAYVVAGNRLWVIDISDPLRAQIRCNSSFKNPWILYLDVVPPFAYVVGGGLTVVDVSDPDNIFEVGYCDMAGLDAVRYDIVVKHPYAYIANNRSGLVLVDVSNPANPTVDTTLSVPWGYTTGVAVLNPSYIEVVGFPPGGIVSVDVSDPTRLQIVDTLALGAFPWGIAISEARSYVASHCGGLQIVDISDPHSLKRIGVYDKVWDRARSVGISRRLSLACVANNVQGLKIVDISDPKEPIERGSFPVAYCFDVQAPGTIAYVVFSGGLLIIDIRKPDYPVELGRIGLSGASRLDAANDSIVYVACGWAGLVRINVRDPRNPKITGRCDIPASDVAEADTIVCVAAGDSGLRVINVSDPDTIYEVGSCLTPGHATAVDVLRDTAYVADGPAGLSVIDISNPHNPIWLDSCDTPGTTRDVAVDPLAYIADLNGGLRMIYESLPDTIYESGYYVLSPAMGVAISDSLVYGTFEEGGLYIFDYYGPEPPKLGIEEDRRIITPTKYNFTISPNPVSGLSSISFSLPQSISVSLKIYDVSGRLVRTLLNSNQKKEAGYYTIHWDGKDDKGEKAPSGVYFCRLETERGSFKTKKMVLLR